MMTGGCGHPKQLAKKGVMLVVFLKEDDDGIQFSHDDAVVITLNIENYDVHCTINNESSANVLCFDAYLKMGMSLK